MKYIIDSNIWVYYFSVSSPLHREATDFIKSLKFIENQYYITTQILIEIYAVLTSTKVTQYSQDVTATIEVLNKLVRTPVNVVGTTVRSMLYLEKMLVKYKPKGQKVWDFQIVASMLDKGIQYIYTHNVKDFSHIEEIKALDPFKPTS